MKENSNQSLKLILELLEDKKFNKARLEILKCNEADAAEIIEEVQDELGIEKAIVLFRMLPKNLSAEVFTYISNDRKMEIINGITDKEVLHIIDELNFDDMIDVLEELPANVVDRVIAKADSETRKLINNFLNYPEDCAGSLMTIEYIGLKKEMTVKEALAYIKENGMDSETVYTCYVMDHARKLEGIISLRKLVISDENLIIKDLMSTDMIRVKVNDDREEVSYIFRKYNFLALPVVDKEGRMVGIITFDDILDVIDEETTEDFQKMAGMEPSQTEYLGTGVITLARNRIIWLVVLMFSYMATGALIGYFQPALEQLITLTIFMPMIMGTAGNSGSQSATLVIRGLATGDIELNDALKVMWKEMRVSLIVGVALATFNFVRIYFFQKESLALTMTVCISLIVVVFFAKILGGLLPMAAKKVGIDPALIASPLIASIMDAISVTTYFTMAVILLNLTM